MRTGGDPLAGVQPRRSNFDLALSVYVVAYPSLRWAEAAREQEVVRLSVLRPLLGL